MKPALGLVTAACVSHSLPAQPVPAPVRIEAPGRLVGDEEAVLRVERMLANLGGAEQWRKAKTLYLKYDMTLSNEASPRTGFTVQYINFERPGDRIYLDLKSSDGTRSVLERGYDAKSGWRRRNGALTRLDKDALASRISYWGRDFYTGFHRFAVPDPTLRLTFVPPNLVAVSDASGAPVGEWGINKDGELMTWRAPAINGIIISYLIGPPKRFGSVSFAGWNGSIDGIGRYTVVEFGLSEQALPAAAYTNSDVQPAKPPMM